MENGSIIECNGIDNLDAAAKKINGLFGKQKVIALYGEMGAGKTTLVKALCMNVGVAEAVNSPTFTIVNIYHTARREPVYHFDFYRTKSEKEVYDTGFEEYAGSGYYCFIEWPEKAGSLLPDDAVKIFIETRDEKRIFKISVIK